ncbi:MAG TPA: 16S rRNA (guanine(527)-N(7))-methyltransferase RsmG [Candidatus Merdisoma merdipullorum]|nr:16S rRNA (guanine(527)-N(7))-methyltransferase RsmG [Candidatus Merdisoma merdipullorum]
MDKQKQLYIKEAFKKIETDLTDNQLWQFERYYELLIQKNEVMNLTAITEFHDVVQKHFVDSLMIQKLYTPKGEEYWLDLGTGAGFPGIPLKIVYPNLKILLLDSLNKRVKFLQEVIEELGLSGITAVHGRAEELARKEEYREQFDCCVSRAVANLAVLSEYCLPFVRVQGCFIPYKSEKIQEEVKGAEKAIHILGGRIERQEEFLLPDSDIYRCLLLVKKEKNSPKKYPRKAGTPSKEPIR